MSRSTSPTEHAASHALGSRLAAVPPEQRVPAVLAGLGLLVMAVLAAFGNFVVVEGLVTDGDAARTAADITASSGLFGLGLSALYAVVLLDVLVAWWLLRFFEPVDTHLARLSMYLRVAYAAVYLVAISQLAGIPGILDGPASASSTEQVQAQALARTETFHDIWFAGLVLFGAHLVTLGILMLRSAAMPRILGALLVVAGAGYVFDTVYDVLRPETTLTASAVTFVGEVLLAIWLVARAGRPVSAGEAR